MRNILRKEFLLSASPLSYLFILFGLMFFLPGYPVLCGAFFVTLGIFQSFRSARETNDILFSVLLPIRKQDIVKGKYLFVCCIELCSALLMGLAVAIRTTVLQDAVVYRTNALMNANGFALGMAFLLFGIFNAVFVGGFFKTAYRFGKPFVCYTVLSFLLIGAAEALHHFPALAWLNAFGTDFQTAQLLILLGGILCYGLISTCSCKRACRHFETLDL